MWINGNKQRLSLPTRQWQSRYVTLNRTEWQAGDRVEITFRTTLDVQPLKKFDQYVSIQYGAMVMAQKINPHGLTHDDFISNDAVGHKTIPTSEASTLVGTIPAIRRAIHRTEASELTLSCQPEGQSSAITLVPFYRLLFDRYEIYFPRVDTPEQLAEAAAAQDHVGNPQQLAHYDSLQIDRVLMADNESEQAHRMESYRSSTGEFMGQHWRHAIDGGFFMYEVKCLPDVPVSLVVRYRQDDSGARLFDMQVDGRTVKTFDHCQPIKGVEVPLYYEEIKVPFALTKGKTSITVKFNAHNHNMAGGLFDLRVLRSVQP